jgi:ABC-type spermidine/putrescine transport system permease subunit I
MNRIRAGYLQIAPDLAPFFIMGVHDDPRGVIQTMSFEPGLSQLAHVLAATPSVVVVVDSVLAAAILAFGAVLLGFPSAVVIAVAVLMFVVSFAIHVRYARGRIRHLQAATHPRFPSPPGD